MGVYRAVCSYCHMGSIARPSLLAGCCRVRSNWIPFASDSLGAVVMRTGLMFELEEGQFLSLGWRAAAAGFRPFHVQLLRSTWVYLSFAFPIGAQVTVRGLPINLTQHSCGGSFWCTSVYVRPEIVSAFFLCSSRVCA